MYNLRDATANRLCGCDCGTPPPPFPSPIVPMSIFEDSMYRVAYNGGYNGTKTEFAQDLATALNSNQQVAGLIIQKGSINDFPDVGLENAIYIDTQKNHIYYWKEDGYYRISTTVAGGMEEGTVLNGGNALTI